MLKSWTFEAHSSFPPQFLEATRAFLRCAARVACTVHPGGPQELCQFMCIVWLHM